MVVRRQGRANDTGRIIGDLLQQVEAAPRYLINSEMCIIRRENVSMQLNELANSLPDVVHQAQEIVQQQDAYRAQAQKECDEMLARAREEAQHMINDAEQRKKQAEAEAEQTRRALEAQVQQIRARTDQEANAIVLQAQENARKMQQEAYDRAQQLVTQAEHRSAELTSQEYVLQKAREEANKLDQLTRQQLDQLHDRVYDFLGGLMAEIDRHLVASVTDLRREYEELQNRRQGRLSQPAEAPQAQQERYPSTL